MKFLFRFCNLNSIYILRNSTHWYARMWLGRPFDAQWDLRSYILPHRGKNRFLKNNISLTSHSLISLFCYYPPLKKMWPFISTQLSPLYTRILCVKFGWNWPSAFLRRRFLNVFSLFGYYLPLKKCMALNLNKFEFPLPKNTLCHVWLKMA